MSATQQNVDSRKAAAYANVVTRLNEARGRSLPFKVSLDCCYEPSKEVLLVNHTLSDLKKYITCRYEYPLSVNLESGKA